MIGQSQILITINTSSKNTSSKNTSNKTHQTQNAQSIIFFDLFWQINLTTEPHSCVIVIHNL